MANTVTNFLEVVGTEEVKAAMDELFNNAGGYADTTQFVNTFYGTEFEGGVSHDWLFENVGAKWIYVENEIGEGEWNISSAGYTFAKILILSRQIHQSSSLWPLPVISIGLHYLIDLYLLLL